MTRNLWGHKWITCCVVFALLNTYMLTALASPAATSAPRGDLSARGRVLLNGQEAISGTAVFSSSSVTTERDSTAVIRLTDLGHVALYAGTDFRLDYDATHIAGALGAGGAEVSSVKGALADISAGDLRVMSVPDEGAAFSLKTAGGVTTVTALKGRVVVESAGRRVPVAAGEFYSSGMGAPGQQPQEDDDDERKIAFLLLGIGGVAAAIIYVVTREDESSGIGGDNGGGINPSPSS